MTDKPLSETWHDLEDAAYFLRGRNAKLLSKKIRALEEGLREAVVIRVGVARSSDIGTDAAQ